jgi:N-terminal domain of anti-restriction factor ArdC
VLLIVLQHKTAETVAGFQAWLKLGYCVRKGEHAIKIWAPCPPTKRQLKAWSEAGADPTSARARTGGWRRCSTGYLVFGPEDVVDARVRRYVACRSPA